MAPTKKKRAPLTRPRVMQAALAIADDAGIEAVTMRAVGERLGVEAMSLYKHVANKDDLLDGLVELVMGEIHLPARGAWRAALRERSCSARAVLLRHRWAAVLVESRLTPGPVRLAHHEAVLRALHDGGFSLRLAHAAFLTLDSYVYGFVLQEVSFPVAPSARPELVEALRPAIDPGALPHLTAMMGFVQRRNAGAKNARRAAEADFEFGLDLVLDGLARAKRRA